VNERVLSVWKAVVLFLETRRTFRGVSGGFEWKCAALPREMILLGGIHPTTLYTMNNVEMGFTRFLPARFAVER
jgi:hypothetical protein